MIRPTLPLFGARDVNQYAQPVDGNGNTYLRLYETELPGLGYDWLFAHHENAKGAVHVVPVITDEQGNQSVLVLVARRPALGGTLSIELPAGLWGDIDENETAIQAARRELKEETGYRSRKTRLLSKQTFATSTGMTTEEKIFALACAGPKRGKPERTPDEEQFLIGEFNVPVDVFMNPARFERYVARVMKKQYPGEEYITGMDIPAASGLMPPLKENKLDITV